MHRPVGPGPLQNSLDVIQSVCRGVSFESDYESIIGLAMHVAIGYVKPVKTCKKVHQPQQL